MKRLFVAVLLVLAGLGIVSVDSSWSSKHQAGVLWCKDCHTTASSTWTKPVPKTAFGGVYYPLPSDFCHCFKPS